VLTAKSIRDALGLALLLAAATSAAQLTAEQDHHRLMDLLHITSLRQGADGRNPQAPNAPTTTNRRLIRIQSCPIRWY